MPNSINGKFLIKNLILIICVVACLFASAQSPAAKIPAFTFFKLDKTPFTDKNLSSNKMVFLVFFDVECEHCQHAIKEINEHYKDIKQVPLYLVSLDTKEKIMGFLNKYGANLKRYKYVTILQDAKSEFIAKFKPRKYPSLFLYSTKKQLLIYDDNEQNLFKFWQKINK